MIDNEAVIRYKLHLCRSFLEKAVTDGVITEQQRKKIEAAVIKRLAV